MSFDSYDEFVYQGDTSLTVGEGYKIKMTDIDTLIVKGFEINPEDEPISLDADWSFVGYLRQTTDSISFAMDNILSNVTIVKNDLGIVYWPGYVYQFHLLDPGKGYEINMAYADTLIYPSNSIQNKSILHDQIIEVPQKLVCNIRTQYNLCLGIQKDGIDPPLEYGDEIGAFAPNGQLVGSCVYTGNNMAFVIWGLDKNTGLKNNETFEIKVWKKRENLICDTKNVVYIEGDNIYYSNKVSVIGSLEFEELLSGNEVLVYPNPANNILLVQSGVNIDVSIQDISGRSVYIGKASNSYAINTMSFGNGPYIIIYSNKEQKILGRQIIIVNH